MFKSGHPVSTLESHSGSWCPPVATPVATPDPGGLSGCHSGSWLPLVATPVVTPVATPVPGCLRLLLRLPLRFLVASGCHCGGHSGSWLPPVGSCHSGCHSGYYSGCHSRSWGPLRWPSSRPLTAVLYETGGR